MSNETLVADASPLIVLFRAGLSHLLPGLWKTVVVTDAVWDEVIVHPDAAGVGMASADWVRRVSVVSIDKAVAARELGRGETDAISFAVQNPSCRVLIDDLEARNCAASLSIPLIGTGALLVLAKKRGFITSVANALVDVRKAGLWLSQDVITSLLELADELQ